MPFPSNTGTKQALAAAWQGAMSVAGTIKNQTIVVRDRSLAGPIGSSFILSFLTNIAEAKLRLAAYAQVPGLAAYAQNEMNDQSLDVVASFTAMVTALDATRDWVIANFPKDGSGFLLAVQFQADGRTTDRQFSTASLATFRAQLDALIATID